MTSGWKLIPNVDVYWFIRMHHRIVVITVGSSSTPSSSFDDGYIDSFRAMVDTVWYAYFFVKMWWRLFIQNHLRQVLMTLSSSFDDSCLFVSTFLNGWWRLFVYLHFPRCLVTAAGRLSMLSSSYNKTFSSFYDESCLIYAFLEFWRRMFLSHFGHHHDVMEWRSPWGIIYLLNIDRWLV